jgi:hypothetical protein
MAISFKAENHKYQSIDPNDTSEWTSVTSIISKFKSKFNSEEVAQQVSKNKKSKWYGKTPEEIINIWKAEETRAVTLGSWFHEQREKELLACETITREGLELPIIRPIYEGDVKFASSQTLTPGIYPEHMIFLKSSRICGQADRIEVIGDTINIYDYKTNKEIKKESYKGRNGDAKKLESPLNHLDDCNYNHYALQLSFYMFMMLKHNHNLKPGKLILHHIIFEVIGEDSNGYPIVAKDNNQEPIVKNTIQYEVPYLRAEVINVINHLKLNQ